MPKETKGLQKNRIYCVGQLFLGCGLAWWVVNIPTPLEETDFIFDRGCHFQTANSLIRGGTCTSLSWCWNPTQLESLQVMVHCLNLCESTYTSFLWYLNNTISWESSIPWLICSSCFLFHIDPSVSKGGIWWRHFFYD